jgi:LPXTG-motif cell wall-anchored protein
VRTLLVSRVASAVGAVACVAAILLTMSTAVVVGAATPVAAADDTTTTCFDASLARQKTEVDTNLTVPQFDPALGTLLDVTVPTQAVRLDTDAVFESTAVSAVVFAERMDYQVVFTSPGGLPSPAPITGTIQRVPSQTLAAFDGTLDFAGPSAVAQPLTARDEAAASVSASDPPTLAAFTGTGTVPFHLATAISETFMGGGGNVQAQIETFIAGAVRVCYRYAPPPPVITPETVPPAVPPVTVPPHVAPALPVTGSSSGWLAASGAVLVAAGGLVALRARRPRARLDS